MLEEFFLDYKKELEEKAEENCGNYPITFTFGITDATAKKILNGVFLDYKKELEEKSNTDCYIFRTFLINLEYPICALRRNKTEKLRRVADRFEITE